ncbi:MAG TPA: TIGR04325 family methyltransferase [Kofleriaceae bacterium]|nr:TIGR04325 family methyltransferase [Kofleriaceae bacterium]
MLGLHFFSFSDEPPSASWRGLSRRALRAIAFSPPIRARLEARYEQHFASAERAHLFRGVYDSFDEAARAAPDSKPLGYDNPGPAAMYRDRVEAVHLSDYPVLFWLARLIRPGTRRLFDLGGHIGLRFYGFRTRLELPDGFQWQVMDVPAVVRAGRELAREKAAAQLTFTDRREDLAGADILFATGSLQYLERPLHEILAGISARPAHVLINQLPMHDGAAYYTLQSIGTAFCPYRIEDRPGLVAGMAALGYEQLDAWQTPEKYCPIPFHPEHSVRGYEGMYFRRVDE